MNAENRVLVIGLDGATFDIILPLVGKGRLPNIAKLMKNGAWGNLGSTVPPVSLPAWPSFMTGTNPGKHGVFHFNEVDKNSYVLRLVPLNKEGPIPFWSLLKHKIVIMEVPYTYPPQRVNGAMISGFLTPAGCGDFAHPEGLIHEIEEEIGERYRIYNRVIYTQGREDEYLKNLYETTEIKAKIILYLMKKFDWSLFVVVITFPDRIQHLFWKFMDKNHPKYEKDLGEKYGESIFNYYERIDEILGSILQNINENTTVIILSDHGHGPLYKAVELNRFLYGLNLLKLKNPDNVRSLVRQVTLKLGLTYEKMIRISRNLGTLQYIEQNIERIPEKMRELLQFIFPREATLTPNIDYSKTKAFAHACFITINLRGKFPFGIVEPGEEYEKLRDFIIDELYRLEDPETKEKIIKRVYKKEEIYSGKYLDDAPDLIVSFNDFYDGFTDYRNELIAVPRGKSGRHKVEGILMMSGKNIRENNKIEGAEIIDLAPTILYLMGSEVPREMDGKVLTPAIEKDFLNINPIRYTNKKIYTKEERRVLTYKEEQEIKSRLRGLGYNV